MGADIYLNSVYQKNHDLYQPLFREAVDERNRLNRLGDTAEAEEMQKLVDEYYDKMYEQGYFRDSYNSTSLMWLLGLSWWQPDVPYEIFVPTENGWKAIADDAYELLSEDEQDNAIHGWGPVACRRMLDRVNERMTDGTFERLFAESFSVAALPKNDRIQITSESLEEESQDWHKLFMGKYEALTSLLRQAIELDEPLHCSV